MTRLMSMIPFFVLSAMLSATAAAQTKTIQGETITLTGRVEAIDTSARTLTIKIADQYSKEIEVPEAVKGFSNVKIGDQLSFRYYDNIVLTLKKHGEPDVNTDAASLTRSVPGRSGTVARQRSVTATITAIDENIPSITFTGPGNRTYSSVVKDRKTLSRVKVGDKVDITWTAALLVSLDPAH
jgi:Cu/Ag efflux protein CusF